MWTLRCPNWRQPPSESLNFNRRSAHLSSVVGVSARGYCGKYRDQGGDGAHRDEDDLRDRVRCRAGHISSVLAGNNHSVKPAFVTVRKDPRWERNSPRDQFSQHDRDLCLAETRPGNFGLLDSAGGDILDGSDYLLPRLRSLQVELFDRRVLCTFRLLAD
jgi:hypothetical protein